MNNPPLIVERWTLTNMLNYKAQIADGVSYCDHCNKIGIEGYICKGCGDLRYILCYDCVERFGREAHSHRRGSAHIFEINDRMRLGCNKCLIFTQPYYEKYVKCSQWSESRCLYDLCVGCMGVHSNVTEHTLEHGPKHKLQRFEPLPEFVPAKIPTPYLVARDEEIICDICHSMIYTQFLRCKDCLDSFVLCTRCVDEGEAAKHVSHAFEYLILSQAQSNPKPEYRSGKASNNPESNR